MYHYLNFYILQYINLVGIIPELERGVWWVGLSSKRQTLPSTRLRKGILFLIAAWTARPTTTTQLRCGFQSFFGSQVFHGFHSSDGSHRLFGFQSLFGSQNILGFQMFRGSQGKDRFQSLDGSQTRCGFQPSGGSQGTIGFQHFYGSQLRCGFQLRNGSQACSGFQNLSGSQNHLGFQI